MKKNYSYIGISFVILIFGILFIPKIINRINNKEVVDRDRHRLERKGTRDASSLVAIGKVPEFSFTNQNGSIITNSNYLGKVYVVEFFFSTCPSICPIMNENMIKIERAIKQKENFGIASFTINPAYDTPEVLKAYASSYAIINPNWHFLTGSSEAIFKLSNEGFNLFAGEAPEVEGGFEHSGFFALIDQEGTIRSRIDKNENPLIYYDGLEEEGIAMLIEDINLLLNN